MIGKVASFIGRNRKGSKISDNDRKVGITGDDSKKQLYILVPVR